MPWRLAQLFNANAARSAASVQRLSTGRAMKAVHPASLRTPGRIAPNGGRNRNKDIK
jgi:hypothetical protein